MGAGSCFDPGLLLETLAALRRRLLECREPSGHWRGEVSTSALSTATAVIALSVLEQEGAPLEGLGGAGLLRKLVAGGRAWLARARNPDGGFGDAPGSPSNTSTTALAWAALSLSGIPAADSRAAESAASWLVREAGGLDPPFLAGALQRRYGEDRTFSAPILMALALAGRLGRGRESWREVPQLPFELAACPASWFRWLKLPVVSYALPALIAIGQARHRHSPGLNPLTRFPRRLLARRTLGVLESLQPSSGGFLEAVPLTSFVVMGLLAAGQTGHPAVREGARFLVRAGREDGSWPIEIDLSTWVTTLSVSALAESAAGAQTLDGPARRRIRDWLLAQQHLEEHPYTRARPGGWAWTDRPGGVPDADDTAGALLALRKLGPMDGRLIEAGRAGVEWLIDLQNRDGGMPTFCRGWGHLPFDRSSPDLTAHALAAFRSWRRDLPPDLGALVKRSMARAARYLAEVQRPDGSWVPLWFGNPSAPGEENPSYGTARVLSALREDEHCSLPEDSGRVDRAVGWLTSVQNADGGWGGAGGVESTIEETALAVHALAVQPGRAGQGSGALDRPVGRAVGRGVAWIIERTERGRVSPAAPIGLYFAKLWYSEKLYPLIFATQALARVGESPGIREAGASTGAGSLPAG